MLIDDEFAAIGSANFQARSMFGVDSELQAAIVADDDLVKRLRVDLWGEHWRLDRKNPAIESALQDRDKALGLWRGVWYLPDTGLWPTLTGYGPPSSFGALQPVPPVS
jgi:phosphatidylserine/phosphatidylglycerophosphate/cardiolipin synthase-like enzyme